MAIENGASNLVPRTLGGTAHPDPHEVAGRMYVATGTLTTAADASDTSSYRLVDLPSNCLLHPDTIFDVENSGFAAVRIGTKTDVDAFVSVARSAATTHSPIVAGDANHGKKLWEILGLAADPGGTIALFVHAIADATGAGTMPFQIHYIYTA